MMKNPEKVACPSCGGSVWFRRTAECGKCGAHIHRQDDGRVIAYASHEQFVAAAKSVFEKHGKSLQRLADPPQETP